MKIILEKPLTWMESERDGSRNTLMYCNLKKVLHSFSFVRVTEVPLTYGHDTKERVAPEDGGYLSYHSIGKGKNVWRIKETPIPYFYCIDRLGYSGWSELSSRVKNQQETIQKIEQLDTKISEDFTDKICTWLINQNLSKYEQNNKKCDLPERFIFFPMQVMNDSVRAHDRLNYLAALLYASLYAVKHKKVLLVKRHPYCSSYRVKWLLLILAKMNKFLFLTDASVTQLLQNCDSIITGNSGVGLEALFYGKCVYSFSYSEYDIAVEKVNTYKEIENAFVNVKKNNINKNKFLYYYFKNICFDSRDLDDVGDKLKQILLTIQEQSYMNP